MQNAEPALRHPPACAVWVHSRDGDLERTHTTHAGGCQRAGSAFCDNPLRLTTPRRRATQRTIATLRRRRARNAPGQPTGPPPSLSLSLGRAHPHGARRRMSEGESCVVCLTLAVDDTSTSRYATPYHRAAPPTRAQRARPLTGPPFVSPLTPARAAARRTPVDVERRELGSMSAPRG